MVCQLTVDTVYSYITADLSKNCWCLMMKEVFEHTLRAPQVRSYHMFSHVI